MPTKIVTTDGQTVFDGQDIKDGQNVWQSLGGQEVGSIWGHGAYTAPDWTADWLHREALFILNHWSEKEFDVSYEKLGSEEQAKLERRLQIELRNNTYDPGNKTISISPIRAEAIKYLNSYYKGLFMNDPKLDELRNNYAIPENSIKDETRMRQMTGFSFGLPGQQ